MDGVHMLTEEFPDGEFGVYAWVHPLERCVLAALKSIGKDVIQILDRR